jgi:TP901 family phage tail tape measure protein
VPRTAETIFVGDAQSLIAAAREAAAATESTAGKMDAAAQKAAAAQEAAAKKTEAAHDKMVASAKKSNEAFAKWGTVAATAVVGASVDMAIHVESAGVAIAKAAGISSEAGKKIEDAFRTFPGTVEYSGAKIGEAFATIAGELRTVEGHALTSTQSMKVMSAALDLTDATGGNLKTTTEALGKVMLTYGLSAAKAAEASDILFNVSKQTGTSVEEVGQVIDRMRGRLGVLAPSLAETGGLLEDFAKHGLKGREALSSLNGVFTTLVGEGKKTKAVLDELGQAAGKPIKVFDNGRFVGLKKVIEELQPVLAKYNQQTQLEYTTALFGAQAGKKLLDIIREGPKAYSAATAAAKRHGEATKAASEEHKTLEGKLKATRADMENLGAKIGEKLLPVLKTMTDKLRDGIEWLEKHKEAAKVLAAVVETVLGAAVLDFAVTKAVKFADSLKNMAKGLEWLGGKFGIIPAAAQEAADKTAASQAAMVETSKTTGTKIAGTNTATGASYTTISTDADAAATNIGVAEGTIVSETAAADAKIEASNATAAGSFAGILGSLGAVGLAAAGGQLGESLGNAGENPLVRKGKENVKREEERFNKAFAGAPSNHRGTHPEAVNSIAEAAAKYHIPASVLYGVYGTETSYGKDVTTSSAGAKGAFQFIQETAKAYNYPYTNEQTASVFRAQAEAAAHYLADLIRQNHGNVQAALQQYSGNTPGYAQKVAANAHHGGVHGPSVEELTAKAKKPEAVHEYLGSDGEVLHETAKQHAHRSLLERKAKIEGAYVAPLAHPQITREDMGLDFAAHPGERIKAIGSGVIDKIVSNWFKGQPLIEEVLTSGSHKGQHVYYAEQINSAVREGQRVKAGQAIGTVAGSGTGLEFGFGAGGGMTLAQARKEFVDHAGNDPTAASKAYASFLKGIGKSGSEISVATQQFAIELKKQEHLTLTAAQQAGLHGHVAAAGELHAEAMGYSGAASSVGAFLQAQQSKWARQKPDLTTPGGQKAAHDRDEQAILTAQTQKKYYERAVRDLQAEARQFGKVRDSYRKFAKHAKGPGAKKEALKKAAEFDAKVKVAAKEAAEMGGNIATAEAAIEEGEQQLNVTLPQEIAQAAEAAAQKQAEGLSNDLSAYQAANSKVDLEARAGLLTEDQAKAAKIANANKALSGGFGGLSEEGRLQVLGDLKEFAAAVTNATNALEAHTKALEESAKVLKEFAQISAGISAVEAGSLAKSLADTISGQIAGVNYAGRQMTAGAGTAARY